MLVTDCIEARIGQGLTGDRFKARSPTREVTLIQAEHIEAVASMMGFSHLDPALLRRNLVVVGINLLALKDREFHVGHVKCHGTGLAHPCSKMEKQLGAGGYNSMRGHGGITARIITSGLIRLGDPVFVESQHESG